jgi:hypothetical protein
VAAKNKIRAPTLSVPALALSKTQSLEKNPLKKGKPQRLRLASPLVANLAEEK